MVAQDSGGMERGPAGEEEEKREKEQQEREERYRLEDEARIREEQEQAAQIEAVSEGQEAVQEETVPPAADGEKISPFIEIADEEDEDDDDKKAEVFPLLRGLPRSWIT